MSSAARQHLRHEALIGGLSNTVFNGVIAWLLLRSGPPLRWSGEHSFVVDIFATSFLLPLIVAAIVIPLQRSKLKKGKLDAISLGNQCWLQRLADHFPYHAGKSALLFGLLGCLVIAPITLVAFYLLQIEQIAPLHYAIFKGIWAGAMAALLVIPMVMAALRPLPAGYAQKGE